MSKASCIERYTFEVSYWNMERIVDNVYGARAVGLPQHLLPDTIIDRSD